MANDNIRKLLVSAGGLGYMPVASGTWGTLAGVAIHVVLALTLRGWWLKVGLGAALVCVAAMGVWLGGWAERFYGKKDPGEFVLDEVAGYLLVPLCFGATHLWLTVLLCFLSARFFDIIKLPPARQAERLPRGWGIMLDDLLASVYAIGGCYAAAWVIGRM